ncbi:hypothetical protein MKK55_13005 [Methylobacterium sp. J-059]|uniref:hypothetical protein n=1 Tax=Methylobacterium sp. J-059 TaxID=2836643 RepID=UPI001FBACCF9|nr:hypothetical protein [Methylobacterium sp. J-059]MCJ2039848.1 hypothetical protein [Methylobacterium sp. J-059]
MRQGYVDPLISDLRSNLDILTQSVTKNLQDVSTLRDALTTAGLETIPAQGRVRFYAIEALQTSVGTTISNFSVTVDALSKKIDLYGSVQTGDLSGLITSISTVRTTLDALRGTITNLVTAGQFNAVADRVSTAETKLDAQAAAITSKASQTTVDAQGARLGTAEQRISASEGRIFQAVQATAGSQSDLALLPQTLSGFFDFIQRQQGGLYQQFATATTNIAASIDDAGRSTASLRSDLLVFKGDASAQFVDLVTAVADTNSALVTRTTLLQAGIAGARAAITTEATARATADSAQTSQLAGAVSRIGAAEASIVTEATTRAGADGAISTRVDGLTATVGQNSANITSLAQTQASDRGATASQFSGVTARFGTVESSVYNLSVSTSAANAALGQRIDTVTARVGSAEAVAANEAYARATEDAAIVNYVNAVNAKTDAANAGVASEASARAAGDASSSAYINDLYARNNLGTAYGRFGMTAVAGPAGVSARLAAQVSTDSYGVVRNAGYFLDLMPDGSSRFVIDANSFLITANGGQSYPFQFDGYNLRVPNLILTSGQVSTPLRVDMGSYLLVGGAGTNNNRIDTTLDYYWNVTSGDLPSIINLFGNLTISGVNAQTGAYATISSMRILIDGAARGFISFNSPGITLGANATSDFAGICCLYLAPGQHRIQLQYTYQGWTADAKVQINELHIAGVTMKA